MWAVQKLDTFETIKIIFVFNKFIGKIEKYLEVYIDKL